MRLVVAHGNHWRAVHSGAADGLVAAAARIVQVDGRRVAVCNGQLGLRFPFLPTHTVEYVSELALLWCLGLRMPRCWQAHTIHVGHTVEGFIFMYDVQS